MIIDVNVNLSRWPFRRLPFDETPQLVARLRKSGIHEAWAGSFDGLLHHDIADVNARLVAECRVHGAGLLRPVGSVNPMLPDWQQDLRRCRVVHGMHAVRLHPNYHSYKLDSPVCDELFRWAAEHKLIIQIALNMQDSRTQHPLVRVPPVDPAPLAALVARHPEVPVIVMNDQRQLRGDAASRLAEAGRVYFEISHAEQVGALEKLVAQLPFERLLFGSHFPFFNLEAALLKFRESQLGGLITQAIQRANAERLSATVR